jgi:formylglycine-generating enzyme required for sulfatase activity
VGEKQPNPFGLHDVYGNVWEWVQDWYSKDRPAEMTDYQGPASGSHRVMRGGSWFTYAEFCRSASRSLITPDNRSNYVGFRLALSPE